MKPAFKPDLFSVSRPGWSSADGEALSAMDTILSCLPAGCAPLTASPEQSGALNINSNNFRLTGPKGRFLLKAWPVDKKADDILPILRLMAWLSDEGLPVAPALSFADGQRASHGNGRLWSLFPFVDGDYFSGGGRELEAVAGMAGRLTAILSVCPSDLHPAPGPEHLSDADDLVMQRAAAARARWSELFGPEYAALLEGLWDELEGEWRRLRGEKGSTDAGPCQPAHFDLHPHNWLVKDGAVAAILDFEACKTMRVGHALSFAGLKCCRQAMVPLGDASPREIGARYSRALCDAYPAFAPLTGQIRDWALAEVFRRICIILRLNIDNGDKRWNKVLPIQLGHVAECHALFG
jgi:Ser/Thr protein kinase RdoA (MazF antagonist)